MTKCNVISYHVTKPYNINTSNNNMHNANNNRNDHDTDTNDKLQIMLIQRTTIILKHAHN